jgi:hypothetical protein
MSQRTVTYDLERYNPSIGAWVQTTWYKSEENGPPQTLEEAKAACKFIEALHGGAYSYRVVKVTREPI